jgi:hypothetical protein
MHLIKEFANLILEAIRAQNVTGKDRPQWFPEGKFTLKNLAKVATMRGLTSLNAYVSSHLELLGSGSSRSAYIYSSNAVLKIAFTRRGVMQNEAEVNIYTDPLTKPVVSKIIDYDPSYRWLLVEPVRALRNNAEFFKLVGIGLQHFKGVAYWVDYEGGMPLNVAKKYDMLTDYGKELVEACAALRTNQGLILADLETLEHWGITSDNRLVILDYGWTDFVSSYG